MSTREPLPFEAELLPGDVTPAGSLRERAEAAVAWCGLLAVDLVLRIGGFDHFLRVVRSCPTLGERRRDPEACRRISAAVDRAAAHYFKKAWCLQRSATNVCLLRLRGIEAHLVIGARKLPFGAHAWVEVGGQVINNHPIVRERYAVLERC
ncbi:MAG TPA: lasso peptide biosynthesis B2 protein [Thermoanaerobaculia bacterium]|nr:lasso peptide biosynthesis B2 protein [Thermoanaerobaculia bacterium]